ncbi:tumor necrosis factor ligand superfamily member 4 [Nothoprocta perdicaria]|uniref:tumor necrosis factor ligand superfamily member 4 n=1 Tax=Nothoprocta perdicaria TaxID=30464 RepID=UPI000E1BA7C4|nr:tumor necrosis factor ligand superfamily member 4 [Nothoprocta perdicaria]
MDKAADTELKSHEHQRDLEREAAEKEWRSWQRGQLRRNTLHLVSAAAQWVLLLACFIYLAIDALQLAKPAGDQVPWSHVKFTGKSVKGIAINLSAERGSIPIRNGSIIIPCDGLYLVSLKGDISSSELDKKHSLKLILGKNGDENSGALWEQTLQHNSETVYLITVFYLFAPCNIALWTNTNATITDLSFSLVLLSPIFYCLR